MTFDVVVVGSGGGALVAAHLAQKAGLSTVVLERTAMVGGTSAYSGGACWLPGSAVQRRAGIDDSTASAREYLEALLPRPLSPLVEVFLAEAPRVVERLEADDAFAFEWLPFPEYFDAPGRVTMGRSIQPVAVRRDELPPEVADLVRPPVERDRAGTAGRRTLTGGQALVARALHAFLRDGGTVLTGHHVTGYVVEDEVVVGVEATGPDGPTRVHSRRGVIAAAGGFEGNPRLRAAHGVPGDAAWTMAPAGTNAGELLEAGIALGARVDHLQHGWLCPGLEQPDGHGSFTLGFRSGVMVDGRGRRYANECLPYDRFGDAMAASPDRVPSYLVFDSREGGRLPAIAMPEGEPAEHLAAGTWLRADTLDELAEQLGMPDLVGTVQRFNGFAATGTDEDFGRGADEYDRFFAGGDGPNPALVPLDTPPYLAARFVLSDLGTKGGLVTDEHARVLHEGGRPIRGLYATSNSAASIFGPVYPGPGAPLGKAFVFAARAVDHLTQEKP
ncbi:FAD binding domain protein [Aeromicrobium marinum DSM 15272]|uniref:FAD binding domain protein n=1 Tax=Aeromicrobium marinum DSM 15272 TaxID=585531 RepID=E2SEL7_9ACTN|nr:FAD-dependent oxidoreductase [Aeromicrobium marinum]EFQ82314.1 FAD binding domain protein [Aeromicrobium marinum DSM 15272]